MNPLKNPRITQNPTITAMPASKELIQSIACLSDQHIRAAGAFGGTARRFYGGPATHPVGHPGALIFNFLVFPISVIILLQAGTLAYGTYPKSKSQTVSGG